MADEGKGISSGSSAVEHGQGAGEAPQLGAVHAEQARRDGGSSPPPSASTPTNEEAIKQLTFERDVLVGAANSNGHIADVWMARAHRAEARVMELEQRLVSEKKCYHPTVNYLLDDLAAASARLKAAEARLVEVSDSLHPGKSRMMNPCPFGTTSGGHPA